MFRPIVGQAQKVDYFGFSFALLFILIHKNC